MTMKSSWRGELTRLLGERKFIVYHVTLERIREMNAGGHLLVEPGEGGHGTRDGAAGPVVPAR